MSSPIKPWLTPLSEKLFSDVEGFVTFLQSQPSKGLGQKEQQEIEQTLQQLKNWKLFAGNVLSVRQRNYIDPLKLEGEPFEVLQASVSGKPVRVIYPKNQAPRAMADEQVQLRRFPSEESEESREEEGKRSDGMFSAVPNSNTTCIKVGTIPFGQQCCIKSGFVFDKCLRRVDKPTERREIFTSFRCEFDELSGRVLFLFPSERYIIKRVGLTTNQHLNMRLKREFKVQNLLTKLGHKNINKILHFFEDEENILSISHSAGNIDMLDHLAKFVKTHRKPFPEDAIRKIFRDVVEGFVVAHNVGIAHRDISLENLVLNSFNSRENFIEIIDWGHSISNLGSNLCPYEGRLGKERYMAPELVFPEGKEYDPFKADVFALGVCFFSMLTGQMPFGKVNDRRAAILSRSAEQLIQVMNEKSRTKNNLSADAIDLLNQCLRWDPRERCSMEQVLNHQFFTVKGSCVRQ